MTTAATLLTEALFPAANTAAAGIGAPGQIGAFGQPPFMSPFASLLAEGSFVQAPGMVPVENSGEASLAALFSMVEPGSMGGIGAALNGRDVPADPAFNVIALFDTTSLSTPAPVTPIPGLGLGVTAQISDGATIDGSSVTPPGDSIVAPAAGQTAKPIPAAPTDSPQTSPARTSGSALAETGGPGEAHAPGPQPSLKGVTAADVAAEIAQLDPQGPGSTGDAAEAAPINTAPINTAPKNSAPLTSGGPLESSTAPVATAAPTALSLTAAAFVVSPASDGQSARQGEAPDPRTTSQIAQSGAVRPPSQARNTTQERNTTQARNTTERATVGKAAAKPTTGIHSALSGDVALAAMAIDTPKPSAIGPAFPRQPAAGRGASETAASLNADVNGKLSSPQPSSPQPSSPQPSSPNGPPSPTGQGNPPPATPGQAFESASLGGDARAPAAEVSDQPAAPRGAMDARMDTPHPAPQPMRGGETAAQPDRPMAAPPPSAPPAPPAPPAEQVALQLRHAVAKGVDRITIQLNPASLGSIDVTLEVSSGARVVVQIVAERADTLDLLRTDARGLERALQEAGLRTDSGSLNFNLRGDGDGAAHHNSSARDGFDETAQAADHEADGDTGADGEQHDSPTHQSSNQMLDIEV